MRGTLHTSGEYHHPNALRVGTYFLPSMGCLLSPAAVWAASEATEAEVASELPALLLLLLSNV